MSRSKLNLPVFAAAVAVASLLFAGNVGARRGQEVEGAQDSAGASDAGAAPEQEPLPVEDGPRRPAQESAPPDQALPDEEPAQAVRAESSLEPRYRFLDDRDALLSSWRGSGLAERLELGVSAGGRELFAVQFGGPGPLPLDLRTTVFLVGGLDGVSISGSEAVLAVTDALLATPDALPSHATFVAIPWANPDGLARWLETACSDGRNDRPFDDDGDGRVDEDPPDDLDEDGFVLEMLREQPAGRWVFDDGGRFLRVARVGEAPRYERTREGRDDDGDGAYNEDPLGGVVPDHNFPVHWRGSWDGVLSGPWPLSEPEALALAELAIERRTAVWIAFQGNHGRLAAPGGLAPGEGVLSLPFAADRPTYHALADSFRRLTEREGAGVPTLREARGASRPGSAVDWCYVARGALAFELAVWGPGVDGGNLETMDAVYQLDDQASATREGAWAQEHGESDVPHDHAWSRWLDDVRGGLGFAGWQPFDLSEIGAPGRGLVGGWKPFTCFNPPADVLPRVSAGVAALVLELARGLPRLEIELEEPRREGRIGILRARVRNPGALPSGVGPVGDRLGTRLRLELPQGARLVAGELEYELGHLPARASSGTFEWLLLAPPDSRFELVVESGWSPPTVAEVSL